MHDYISRQHFPGRGESERRLSVLTHKVLFDDCKISSRGVRSDLYSSAKPSAETQVTRSRSLHWSINMDSSPRSKDMQFLF